MITEQLTIDYKTGEIVTPDDAWNRHRRIVDLRNVAEKTFLALGEELYWFEELKQYKEMEYETFEAYLADPDVDISRLTAFRLKGVYSKYVLGLKVSPVKLLPAGYSKLYEVCPYVNESNVDDWINKASSLSRSDLKREIADAFPPPPPPPLPAGKYSVIYADPPWEYQNSGFDESAGNQYPTMPTQEICDLPVRDLAGDETVLFLWATNPLLPEALAVMDAWGFEYKTNIAWVKDRGRGKGWYLRSKHELLLIGVRTNTPHPEERPDSAHIVPRPSQHSRKPDEFYWLIENMYLGNKIELFARRVREGWDSWGNEL